MKAKRIISCVLMMSLVAFGTMTFADEPLSVDREAFLTYAVENSDAIDGLQDTIDDLRVQLRTINDYASQQEKAEAQYKASVAALKAMNMPIPEELDLSNEEFYNSFYSMRVSKINILSQIEQLEHKLLTVPNTIEMSADNLLSQYLYLKDMTVIQAQNLEIEIEKYEQLDLKYDLGQISKLDYNNAQWNLAILRMENAQTKNQMKSLELQLFSLADLDLDQEVVFEDSYVSNENLIMQNKDYYIASALDNRVDILDAQSTLDAVFDTRELYYAANSPRQYKIESDANYEVALKNFNAIKDDITKDITNLYDDASNKLRQYELSLYSEKLALDQYNQTKQSFNQGLVDQMTLDLVELNYNNSVAAEKNAHREFLVALNVLEMSAHYGTGN